MNTQKLSKLMNTLIIISRNNEYDLSSLCGDNINCSELECRDCALNDGAITADDLLEINDSIFQKIHIDN